MRRDSSSGNSSHWLPLLLLLTLLGADCLFARRFQASELVVLIRFNYFVKHVALISLTHLDFLMVARRPEPSARRGAVLVSVLLVQQVNSGRRARLLLNFGHLIMTSMALIAFAVLWPTDAVASVWVQDVARRDCYFNSIV